MNEADNPFVPGTGTPPPLLVGRDKLVRTAQIALSRAKNGRHGKSFVAVGLRGVGKTVVIMELIHNIALKHGKALLEEMQEFHEFRRGSGIL